MAGKGPHREAHRIGGVGWLRAAVLGANDGVVSTAGLIVGVAAASADRGGVLIAGLAGLAAGAMSMAAGEYVSVSSQADAETAELARERRELADDPAFEREELARIYQARGLEPELAGLVADRLMAKDALGAHARDELGISEVTAARPVQAAFASAAAFSVGAAGPLAVAAAAPAHLTIPAVAGSALAFLAALGAAAARLGGADVLRASARVAFWGAAAMALTFAVGRLFGAAV